MCCGWGERESIWNTNECSSAKSGRAKKMPSNGRRSRLIAVDFRFLALYGLFLSVCLMIYSTAAAPAAAAAAMKSVINYPQLRNSHIRRLKRDAEISFGNSQNEPRDKKSAADNGAASIFTPADTSPEAAAVPEAAAAAVPAELAEPAAVKHPNSAELSAAGEAAAKSAADAKADVLPETAAKQAAAGATPTNVKDDDKAVDEDNDNAIIHADSSEDNGREHLQADEDQQGPLSKEKVERSDLVVSESNNEESRDNDDDVIKSDAQDDAGNLIQGDASDAGQESEASENSSNENTSNQGKEDDTDHSSTTDSGDEAAGLQESQKEGGGSRLTKRSIPSMVAENMGKDVPNPERHRRSPSRTKRDLGYDELREILEGGEGQSYPSYSEEDGTPVVLYPEDDADESDYDSVRLADVGDFFEPSVESGGDDTFLLSTRKEEAIQKEIVRYEVLQRLLKEKEEQQAKEAVLEYLIAAAEDRLKEAVEEEREAEIDERLEKLGLTPELLLETPAKSQVGKRFPYSYEPYGGPWGAVVPGIKRSASYRIRPVEEDRGYERLYKLAEALGDY